MRIYKLSEFIQNKDLSAKMKKAVDFLANPKSAELPDGKYAIEGNTIFAQVQTYTTAEPKKVLFEAHKKYIDIQYIVSGEEIIDYIDLENIEMVRPYDEKYDICFGVADLSMCVPLRLAAGDMVVFFPEDAHAPKLPYITPAKVKKIVVKVAV